MGEVGDETSRSWYHLVNPLIQRHWVNEGRAESRLDQTANRWRDCWKYQACSFSINDIGWTELWAVLRWWWFTTWLLKLWCDGATNKNKKLSCYLVMTSLTSCPRTESWCSCSLQLLFLSFCRSANDNSCSKSLSEQLRTCPFTYVWFTTFLLGEMLEVVYLGTWTEITEMQLSSASSYDIYHKT